MQSFAIPMFVVGLTTHHTEDAGGNSSNFFCVVPLLQGIMGQDVAAAARITNDRPSAWARGG